ncbi:MAG: GNAT family N-acetyltransferase [Anaerolineales bacterium]|nr:GNAT family N-acetyltransferase [Anaerolineales bacterium]
MTSSEQTYTLHPYHPRFAAGMAQMWNESDHQWPGTFTKGVPFDEPRILEWMERVAAIIKFVIEEDQTGKIVGYGDLWEETMRPGACYVALLNVHPDHQGHSLARRMLHEMVNWATEHGYDKLTIGTWPSNLKAMPLYKKVGFFWQPGTGVFMENYVPAVRQLPLAKTFFERHDWYRDYQRDLKQIEDEMRHPKTGDTKVYTLRWAADGDLLEAVFDRNGQRLAGLATNDFAAYTRIGDSEPAQGVTYPVEWEVSNTTTGDRARTMSVSLFASGDPGIEVTHRATFDLAPGETRLLNSTYRVAHDAPKFEVEDHERLVPRLNTLFVVDGQVVEFGSGLRYRPPVEFSLGPNGITLMPGQAKTVHLQLKNRTQHPLEVAVTVIPDPTFGVNWTREHITVPAKGQAGLPITLTPTRGGEIPLTVQASFTIEGQAITTPAKILPLLALEPGGLAVGREEDAWLVENDFFRLHLKRKGAWATLTNKTTRQRTVLFAEEIGPPFVPWELEDTLYDLHAAHENGAIRLTARAASARFPGLVVTREMIVTATPLVAIRHRVVNTGSVSHEFQIRPGLEFMQYEHAQLTLPLRERLIQEHGSMFGGAHHDIPEDLARFAEPWIAYEENGQVAGAIWPASTEKVTRNWEFFLFTPKQTLAPQEVFESDAYHILCGPGDWRVVRQTWARLTGKSIEPVTPKRHFEVELTPNPLLTLAEDVHACLKLTNTRKLPLTGTVKVTAPEGWQVSSNGASTQSCEVPFADLTHETPVEWPVRFHGLPQPGAFEGHLHFNTQRFDHTQPITILRLGRGTDVHITPSTREGFALWQINNGQTAWEIAPDFHRGIISWRETGQDTSHLFTSFPQDGELSWMKPFFGGLRPTLYDPKEGRGWPGKLHTETFTATPVEGSDMHGLAWKGLRLIADLQKENCRGLRAELDYLTLPGSNVLKFVFRLVNLTSTYHIMEPGLLIFPSVDGDREHTTLHNAELHRKRTDQTAWVISDGWAAVENTETGRTLVAIPASGKKQSQLMDWGNDGGNMHIFDTTELAPNATAELVVYLALAGSLEEARRYGALAK